MSLRVSKVIISGVWTGLAGEHLLELFTGAVPAEAAGDQELPSGSRAAALGGHTGLDCTGGSPPCLASLWLRVSSVVLAAGLEPGLVSELATVKSGAGGNGSGLLAPVLKNWQGCE